MTRLPILLCLLTAIPARADVKETPIRSDTICAELDLRILNNAVPVDPEVIEGMRRDFEHFVADAINRCSDGKTS